MPKEKKITVDVEKLRKCLNDILGNEYYCTRDWSAWQAGTMTEEDFKPIDVDEIVNSIEWEAE